MGGPGAGAQPTMEVVKTGSARWTQHRTRTCRGPISPFLLQSSLSFLELGLNPGPHTLALEKSSLELASLVLFSVLILKQCLTELCRLALN